MSEEYTGYKVVDMTDEELAEFYENGMTYNFGILTNEYLIINHNGEELDTKYRWDGEKFVEVKRRSIKCSRVVEKVSPKTLSRNSRLI